jgi:hypothetical protein
LETSEFVRGCDLGGTRLADSFDFSSSKAYVGFVEGISFITLYNDDQFSIYWYELLLLTLRVGIIL